MADDTTHPRPDQAEEPVDDVGASNVDLDEARHGAAHTSPAVPEEGHEPDDDHGHDDHDEHDDHLAEDPKWVLVPLLVGVIVAVVVLIVVGIQAGAAPT